MLSRSTKILGFAAIAGLGALTARRSSARERRNAWHPLSSRSSIRTLDWAATLLALSAFSDSAVEHYRGSFHNKAMYVPLAVSAIVCLESTGDAMLDRERSGDVGLATAVSAIAAGVIGSGFHIFNVLKRPGRFSWLNLFYGAPLGAPAALSLAGLLRLMAHIVRNGVSRICGVPIAKLLAGLVSAGLIGTSAEAGLLHFRGAYQNPAMYLPVTLPPVAAALLAGAAIESSGTHRCTRAGLKLITAMGLLGSAFHTYGIHRAMGGWRNWSQNILNGPPLPAPPAFTALGLAGLAALALIEGRNHD